MNHEHTQKLKIKQQDLISLKQGKTVDFLRSLLHSDAENEIGIWEDAALSAFIITQLHSGKKSA